MKIGVVGLGYIGSVTAAVLASARNKVVGIEIDKTRLDSFKSGEPPIYEPGLKEILSKNKKNIKFSSDFSELDGSDVVFLTVPTPTVNGKIDLQYIFSAAESVQKAVTDAVVVIKSTVVPGTAKEVHKRTGLTIVSNPEFTREGTAIEDTRRPNRVIIGATDKKAVDIVDRVWAFTKAPVIKTTNENAEMIKYASNAFLATKISFINEIANLCERIPGCDVEVIAKGMGLDQRIAPYFLKAGIGFGGSCFPKDTAALASFARENGETMSIIESAIKVNDERLERVLKLLKEGAGGSLVHKKVGILGVTFKENTDDVRGSQIVKLIKMLRAETATVGFYDPKAKIELDGVYRFPTKERCVEDSDIVLVATEWPEFKNLKITNKPVVDAKRILNPRNFKSFKAVGLYT